MSTVMCTHFIGGAGCVEKPLSCISVQGWCSGCCLPKESLLSCVRVQCIKFALTDVENSCLFLF